MIMARLPDDQRTIALSHKRLRGVAAHLHLRPAVRPACRRSARTDRARRAGATSYSFWRIASSMSGVARITGAWIPSFTGAVSHRTPVNRRRYQGSGHRFCAADHFDRHRRTVGMGMGERLDAPRDFDDIGARVGVDPGIPRVRREADARPPTRASRGGRRRRRGIATTNGLASPAGADLNQSSAAHAGEQDECVEESEHAPGRLVGN